MSQIAAKDEVGSLIGTIEGVESFSGIVGPTIGGLVAQTGKLGPLVVVVTGYVALTILVLRKFKVKRPIR